MIFSSNHHTSFFPLLYLLAATVPSAAAQADPDMGDHPEFAHAMKVETRTINGIPVVFHYDQVRPDFNDLTDNPHRTRMSLDGDWAFRFDPKSMGVTEKWFSSEPASGPWKNIKVPHCWDATPGGRYWDWDDQSPDNPPHYNGAAWYQKSFSWKPSKTDTVPRRQRITFINVQQRARVYLNGNEIALHEGGGAPFSIDVTGHLEAGANTLALKVLRLPNFKAKTKGKGWEEISYVHTLHPKAPDCWPYAGIMGSVALIDEPAVSIRKCLVSPKHGQIRQAVVISNHGKTPFQIRVSTQYSFNSEPPNKGNLFVIEPGQTRVAKFTGTIIGKITEWSPQSPTTYEALTMLYDTHDTPIDQLCTRFGFRSFETDGPTFKLNGKSCFLKGSSIYSEHFTRGGAITNDDHLELFKLARDCRSNFIRAHVVQRDPYFYQLADQQGFLVCGEWGGFWYREKAMAAQTKDPYSIYQTMARCAVWDLMNHPSVVMWGLHNECHQFCPEYEPFLKMGRDLVHEIDCFEKLPITWAAWHPHLGKPHFEHADAVGFNEYRGAMDPFEKLDPDLKKVTRQNPGKPIIILENGAWSKRGKRGSVTQKGTEDWQADLLKRQWQVLSKHSPPFAGYTYWLLTDYRSRKQYTGNRSSNGYSRMGIYDESGKAKVPVRDAFRDLKNPLEK
ncbi:MAG: hypothetical protein H7A51_11300 [Akkermansiaceae bacterium]|nr:hypothetical protein [Akkermansiaceae bacterium]